MTGGTTTPRRRYNDVDKAQARTQVARAFSLAGLLEGGRPVCPSCGTSERGKVKLFPDGWRCHKEGKSGDAISVLTARGWSFLEAMAALLGESDGRSGPTTPLVLPTVSSFVATVDTEAYTALVRTGDVAAAGDFYGRFAIAAEAVADAGFVRLLTPEDAAKYLERRFGIDRLIAAGLYSEHGRPLFGWRYPVIEPHHRPDGTIAGIQLRGGEKVEADVAAHKRGEGSYTPKTLSLRGATSGHQLGIGLARLAQLRANTPVRIVEGGKDLLAARTLGWEAYALPGAGTTPPPVALETLSRHRVQVAFDGDDAGQNGAESLAARLSEAGLTVIRVRLPKGLDVADMLARRTSTARRR
jgi:hypothetical protein